MRRSRLYLPFCLLLALGLAACDTSDKETLVATLSGANEVPASGSAATGTATFEIDGTTVTFDLQVNGITGVTMAHIHSGATGANGPVRVDLFLGPVTGAVNGRLAQASFTAANVRGITFDELLAEMRASTAYVNVHTAAIPSGEIRGQIQD